MVDDWNGGVMEYGRVGKNRRIVGEGDVSVLDCKQSFFRLTFPLLSKRDLTEFRLPDDFGYRLSLRPF